METRNDSVATRGPVDSSGGHKGEPASGSVESREARLNRLLADEAFSFADRCPERGYAHPARTPRLLTEEGDVLCTLQDATLGAIDQVDDSGALALLQQMYAILRDERNNSYRAGVRTGRNETISTVHELLGIGRLVEAADKIETALRDSGSARRGS